MNKVSLTLFYLFEKLLLTLPFTHYIAVSKNTKSALIKAGIEESKITTIYNGIDYSKFKKSEANKNENIATKPYNFIYFGRLGISKGLDLILSATQLLAKKNDAFKLHLVIPKTPLGFYKKIIDEIEKSNIQKHIDVHSHLPTDTLQQLIVSSDAAIVPSYSEGFGYSAVEAIALDVPIIHSGKGSLSEVVSGRHIRMRELSGESLMQCMHSAILEEWNISPIKRFHLSDSVQGYMAFYNKLITKG
jgi:glycosyltransferase involved in cell wall biosynthesis